HGIDRVEIRGLPEQQISIEISNPRLQELGMSLDQVAERVAAESRDLPAGLAGELDAARELRAVEQRRAPEQFANLPLEPGEGNHLRLGDVANIRQKAMRNQPELRFKGYPAVELILQRAENGDSLVAAEILNDWLAEVRPTLPPDLSLHVHD